MPIDDPSAIQFANETVRPLSERVRAIKANIDATLLTWSSGGMSTLFSNDGELVQDGRENVPFHLTGADVHNLMNQLTILQTALDQPGVPEVIGRGCVRTLIL